MTLVITFLFHVISLQFKCCHWKIICSCVVLSLSFVCQLDQNLTGVYVAIFIWLRRASSYDIPLLWFLQIVDLELCNNCQSSWAQQYHPEGSQRRHNASTAPIGHDWPGLVNNWSYHTCRLETLELSSKFTDHSTQGLIIEKWRCQSSCLVPPLSPISG